MAVGLVELVEGEEEDGFSGGFKKLVDHPSVVLVALILVAEVQAKGLVGVFCQLEQLLAALQDAPKLFELQLEIPGNALPDVLEVALEVFLILPHFPVLGGFLQKQSQALDQPFLDLVVGSQLVDVLLGEVGEEIGEVE